MKEKLGRLYNYDLMGGNWGNMQTVRQDYVWINKSINHSINLFESGEPIEQ